MGFFRDPQSRLRDRDRDFLFWLDRKILKIPKSRGSGSGFENPEESRVKIPKFWVFTVFWPSGFSENPRDSGYFLSLGVFILGIWILLNFGIFIYYIIAKSPAFIQNPRNSGFFRDFLPSGSGFFSWDGITRQKANSANGFIWPWRIFRSFWRLLRVRALETPHWTYRVQNLWFAQIR